MTDIKKYIIKDKIKKTYFTGSLGDNSVKLEAIHTRNQAFNDPNSWITLESTRDSSMLKWGTMFLDEDLRMKTETIEFTLVDLDNEFVLKNKETDNVSKYSLEMIPIPENYISGMEKGFERSEDFPDEYTFIIDESKGMSIMEDKLFIGKEVPVKIFKRNDVYAFKFENKYLSLSFSNDKLYEQIKSEVRTVNYTPDGSDIIEYSLTNDLLDEGLYNSSLFNITEVDESDRIYRIENFHFPDTYVQISDDGVFFPSVMTTSSSEIIFESGTPANPEPTPEKKPEETEREKLYGDLGLSPQDIEALEIDPEPIVEETAPVVEEPVKKDITDKVLIYIRVAFIIFLIFVMMLMVIF